MTMITEKQPAWKEPNLGVGELRRTIEMLSAPIDFASLIRAGVIRRRGHWYEIRRWEDLPEHARAQISSWKCGEELLVRFQRNGAGDDKVRKD